MEIRDGRLYREQGCPTFEAYCQQRWGGGGAHGYNVIRAAEAALNVFSEIHSAPTFTQAVTLAPLLDAATLRMELDSHPWVTIQSATERQLRELKPLLPEQRVELVERAAVLMQNPPVVAENPRLWGDSPPYPVSYTGAPARGRFSAISAHEEGPEEQTEGRRRGTAGAPGLHS